MQWRILGSLEVCRAGALVVPRPRKHRVLLGMLLLNPNRHMPTALLVDGVWDGRPPGSAKSNLHSYVTQLRRMLDNLGGDARLSTVQDGYRLRVEPGELDSEVFEATAAAGRKALAAGRADEAAQKLAEALALWRGDVLADIDLPEALRPAATRLHELRVTVIEDRIDALLAMGRSADLIPELIEHTAAHPLRERLCGQLMIALHLAGRTPEALALFRRFRQRLVDELAVEPGLDLQQVHRRILAPEQVPDVRATPRYLPSDVAGFTGRDLQLRQLDAFAAGPVIVVSGMAGVGKTALAVHWAHRVADRFPDGQLYVNLRGYAPESPLAPAAALTLFLRALGVPVPQVPIDLDEAAGLFRSLLSPRRMLLILDNARSAEQVRAVLPGAGACVTVVTSRDRLTGLVARDNARRITLEPLSRNDSIAVLRHILAGAALDPSILDPLAEMCGHLPLALRIAAAKVADQPPGTQASYVDSLAASGRLRQLVVAGDPQASVRAAFEYSYRPLPARVQLLFRLMSLAPGGDVTAESAAALLESDPPDSLECLGILSDAHLAEQRTGGRYGMHDLLRQFAREEVDNQEGLDAIERLCEFYLGGVNDAGRLLYGHFVRMPAGTRTTSRHLRFADAGEARRWLDAELASLVALINHAAGHGPRHMAALLADGLRGYFWIRRPFREWLATASDGLAAADTTGDAHAVTAMNLSLGQAYRTTGRVAEADASFVAALQASRAADWPEAEASVLGQLAVSKAGQGASHEAVTLLGDALLIQRRLGRRAGEAVVLTNLGTLNHHLGNIARATSYAKESLVLYRESGNLGGEALALSNIGINCVYLGRYGEARRLLTDGQRIAERIGDRVALALGGYGFTLLHAENADFAEALRHAQGAVELAHTAGDLALESACLTNLAFVTHQLRGGGDPFELCARARSQARQASNVHVETEALIVLARLHADGGSMHEATMHAQEALALSRQWRYRLLEGEALRITATIRARAGEAERAREAAEAAHKLLVACGYRLAAQRAQSLLSELDAAGS